MSQDNLSPIARNAHEAIVIRNKLIKEHFEIIKALAQIGALSFYDDNGDCFSFDDAENHGNYIELIPMNRLTCQDLDTDD